MKSHRITGWLARLLLVGMAAGCGSSSGDSLSTTTPTTPGAPQAVAPLKFDGVWDGQANGLELRMVLEQRDNQVMGHGLMTTNGDLDPISLSGELQPDGTARLEVLHQDGENDSDNGDLEVRLTGNPPQAVYTSQQSQVTFPLTRPPVRPPSRSLVLGRIWDGQFSPLSLVNPNEVYRIIVEGRNQNVRLDLQLSVEGTTLYEWVGGWQLDGGPKIYGDDRGRFAATTIHNGQTDWIYLKDAGTFKIYGNLVFPRISGGQPLTSVALDPEASDLWIDHQTLIWGPTGIHGTVTLLQP